MAILNGTFTRRIFSSFPTEYHVLLFMDDDKGLISVILNTNELPPIDTRVRLNGRYRSSVDYGERFACSQWQKEQDYQKSSISHDEAITNIRALLGT